ncbi:hypothetical protein N836_04365 [Leptolyngbya sp. Heron Island J]|uniref:hypothetical protein n=1 Tax=Leptolyngbya sp. Heron Island J TaxID=1385935 RepID=UPI0003B9401D|nr:hypothetical protein [Leptolyngbya sp. Heron Island J]ESA37108.1 hypothetical protein N836_04365 [Leptolyngbya sp. Heron Island J]
MISIWGSRYLADLSESFTHGDPLVRVRLREAALKQGREHTAQKLHSRLIEQQCSLAAVRVKDLYSKYDASVFVETAHIAKFLSRLYLKLLEAYSDFLPVAMAPEGESWEEMENISLDTWGIPNIVKLANALRTLLLELQQQYMLPKNWQSLGFLTTQINLTNSLLLQALTPAEQALINPYFKFLEEYVAIPWQRLCLAATNYPQDSASMTIVESMLSLATKISGTVYEKWYERFPTYNSRRGTLNHPGIIHSCIRDFDMFQVYLWVCFLEGNLSFVQQELSPICIIIFHTLGIPWEMTFEGTIFLMHEILKQLEPYQKDLVRPYTQEMINIFMAMG